MSQVPSDINGRTRMESQKNSVSQNCTDTLKSSEVAWSHEQLIGAALISRSVVVLEKLQSDDDAASYRSALENEQITPMCIKQEPADMIPTMQGRHTYC